MAYGNGKDSAKISRQRNCQKYSERSARAALQYYVAKDVNYKNNSIKHGYNSSIDKDKGIKWFNDGYTLEDAPEDMKNNVSFLNGYNYAYRIKLINDKLFELGVEYYNKGIALCNIPEKYSDNMYFMDGYNSCKTRSR